METNIIQPAILSADDILLREWPEPEWAIPGILPIGLSILAGRPKIGKSWLALQSAKAVAEGGMTLNVQVKQGSVLYLALEDQPRRLQERMRRQGWTEGLPVQFVTGGYFRRVFGTLSKGGFSLLSEIIENGNYRLVIIDTYSRAFAGDQDDVNVTTSILSPLQEMAIGKNFAVLMTDHHHKYTSDIQDIIEDILGSVGKGGVADTILGLYRERGKLGARLKMTGRDIEDKSIDLKMDWPSGTWLLDGSKDNLTPEQQRTFVALKALNEATPDELGEYLARNRGSVYKDLAALESRALVAKKDDGKWVVMGSLATMQPMQP